MRYQNTYKFLQAHYPNFEMVNTGGGIEVIFGNVPTKDGKEVLVAISDECVSVWAGELKKTENGMQWDYITFDKLFDENPEIHDYYWGNAYDLSFDVADFNYEEREIIIKNTIIFDLFNPKEIGDILTVFHQFTIGYGE